MSIENDHMIEFLEGIKTNLLKPMAEDIKSDNNKKIEQFAQEICNNIDTLNKSLKQTQNTLIINKAILCISLLNLLGIIGVFLIILQK